MKRVIWILLAGLAFVAAPAFAQDPVAVLVYFDDDFEVQVVDGNGFDVNFYIGVALNPGDRVVTANSSAEIRMEPNGSIVRIAPNTDFVVESIQGRDGAEETGMRVAVGRVRMVAARATGRDERYSVRTPTAVAGVRGTDFGVDVVPAGAGEPSEELFVFEGEVLFESATTGEQIFVTQGQRANVFAPTFVPQQMTEAEIASRSEGLGFQGVDPAEVPGNAPAEPEPAPAEEEAAVSTEEEEVAEEEEEAEPGLADQLFARLAEITGMNVGSVTIGDDTYAQVVFQPNVQLGRLNLGLYLPITYNENLFDPNDWYRPAGNDEWSFGTDQDWENDPVTAALDVWNDVSLKIRSLEFGERGDNFFLKLGSLDNFTVGQGLLMRNYANDADFPAVRRLGFNLGIDGAKFGFESLVNDLRDPTIYGGRIYIKPAGTGSDIVSPLETALGLSSVVDLGPASNLNVGTLGSSFQAAATTDPILINVGIDLEVPLLDIGIFSMISYAEAGGLLPYLREPYAPFELDAGVQIGALYSGESFSIDNFRNYGWIAGVRGRVLIMDYRVEMRQFNGSFRGPFVGPNYDRQRETLAAEAVAYLQDPAANSTETLGVFGEAGASLFNRIFLTGGYFWPWEIDESGNYIPGDSDELVFTLAAEEGTLPFGATVGFEYRREGFAQSIGASINDGEEFLFFDPQTVFGGMAAIPLNDFAAVVVRAGTTTLLDENGQIVYDDNGAPRIAPSVSITTELGF